MTAIKQPYSRREAPSVYDPGFLNHEHDNIARSIGGANRLENPLEIVRPEDFSVTGDRRSDDGANFQRFIDACSTDSETDATPMGYFPGRYRSTRGFVFKKMYVRLMGAGMRNSEIYFDGLGAGVPYFSTASMPYLRPYLSDFRVTNNNCTGMGFDLSNVTSEVYNGAVERVFIYSGSDCFYAPRFFSMEMNFVWGSSETGHSFRVSCGPGVSWTSPYAVKCGPGKAGFRLAGVIRLYSANGVNSGDNWGVFGSDPAVIDGFQNDFVGNDYADVVLEGANIEAFNVRGIYCPSPYTQLKLSGGTFTRTQATPFHSLIHTRAGSNGVGGYVELENPRAFISGGAPTNTLLYSDVQDFVLIKGNQGLNNITGFYCAPFGGIRPAIRVTAVGDVYQDTAVALSAAQIGRLTAVTSLNIGGAGGIAGVNGAAANSSAKFVKSVTGIANAVATTVLTISALNVSQNALVRVSLSASLGAGGAVGANEANATVSYDIAVTRVLGVNAVAVATAAITGATAVVAGGATITVTAALGAVTGAVGAANSVLFQATITRGGGASTNHTCLVTAEVINANASGVTIS